MTTRPYELLARFAADGSVAGVSVRTITTIDGRDYEGDPRPLAGVDDPAFAAFAEQFAAAVVAERDALKTQLDVATSAAESQRADLQSQLDAAIAQRDATQSQLETMTADRDAMKTQLDAAIAERDALVAQVAQLRESLPWDPRILDASAFVARIAPAELVDLFASTDPGEQSVAAMLREYLAHDWPIMLDSPELKQAVEYLVAIGRISRDRAAELTRDATRDESYRPGE